MIQIIITINMDKLNFLDIYIDYILQYLLQQFKLMIIDEQILN